MTEEELSNQYKNKYTVNIHPTVIKHVQILEQYLFIQKKLNRLLNNQNVGEFEYNTYQVELLETEKEFNEVAEQLEESVIELGDIKPVNKV